MMERELTGLDVLRGIAILLVIVAHFIPANVPYALPVSIAFANTGVILFFFLSGFLMDRILAVNSSIWPYAIKRAFRILPTYWLSIGLIFVVSPIWTASQIAANATLTAPAFGIERMSGVYWTLYVEVAFYALAPFLRLFDERTIRTAPFAFAAITLALWVWRGTFPAPAYIVFCITGMMIGSFYREGRAHWMDQIIKLRLKPIEFVGHVSYSWYLLHPIIGFHFSRAAGAEPWSAAAIGIIISFAVSVAIHYAIEKPMIRIGRYFSFRSMSSATARS